MTLREKIESTLHGRTYGEGTLRRVSNRGRRVWAVVVTRNSVYHKYTLSSGVACANWWPTLASAADDLQITH